MSTSDDAQNFDAIVVGTGFAGAVTACRLVEAGYRICVLERGRRYQSGDFPRYPTEDLFVSGDESEQHFAPPPDFSRWLWSRDFGIYDVRDLGDAVSVQAAGYGGGSLIYANVHIRPPRKVFERGWPEEYNAETGGEWNLTPYFDLAAYMLRVSPIPNRLAKTLQLKHAAEALTKGDASPHWFRLPLAVNFDRNGKNDFEREQHPCDMRGRCWMGCDHQAKNTLDMNYLARAEAGHPDIRTLAEVITIRRENGKFTVTYRDLLIRDENKAQCSVSAKHVFLCAGSVATTELLLRNLDLWDKSERASINDRLGSHYFPNADSFSVVFECNKPHEADYGPTITSALLYQRAAEGSFSRSLDFENGRLAPEIRALPEAGAVVTGMRSGKKAELSHAPILDWGSWEHGTADGTLVLANGEFESGEELDIGGLATAKARSAVVTHENWFLAEDGGYPPDVEPLVGLFRSPLWLRRNRFRESSSTPAPGLPRRPPGQSLRVDAFADALGGSAEQAPSGGFVDGAGDQNQLQVMNLLDEQVKNLFPEWFADAAESNRKELLAQAAAMALPMLGRLLDELSKTIGHEIDPDDVSRLGLGNLVQGDRKEVLIRGMLRQGLQVIAGSEVALADKAAELFTEQLPVTPEKLLEVLGQFVLWALAYGATEGHTAVILTMGRDLYRGKLELERQTGHLKGLLRARLPGELLDTSSFQERVLRAIARDGWHGELRTNPAWTPLSKRVTVHSQGGCPMGPKDGRSITSPWGDVYGCPGLYVMDAAAFPTSVGVNPSATVAAIAELKVEHFIQERIKNWKARDKDAATEWVDKQGRSEIDPLRHRAKQNEEPEVPVLGLKFTEKMRGFFTDVVDTPSPKKWENLPEFPQHIETFTNAEDAGITDSLTISTKLEATVADLAQLISPDRAASPMKIKISGTVTMLRNSREREEVTCQLIDGDSFLQFFVRPSPETDRPVRFFRYKLSFDKDSKRHEIHALKVLRDERGNDVWDDTSTLYFEIFGGEEVRRGILRLSFDEFLRKQLPSMDVTGTDDPARRSWALAAFYKFFAREVAGVYMRRTDQLAELFGKVLTAIHV